MRQCCPAVLQHMCMDRYKHIYYSHVLHAYTLYPCAAELYKIHPFNHSLQIIFTCFHRLPSGIRIPLRFYELLAKP